MKRLAPYELTAEVTISLGAVVWATSKADALRKAQHLLMPTIHDDARYEKFDPNDPGVSDDSWGTSGELDGEPMAIAAEKAGAK